ncbi:MAG: sugar ABC transporter permease [Burkholderiales bacterium]|nr:sugar ABC transporter permease [Anaerolineae bacterium]
MATSNAAHALAVPARERRTWRQDKYAPYFFISPFYILFALFFLFPTLFALVLGFFKWSALGTPEWFGLRNYERLFSDDQFWQSVRNTFFYASASLLVVMPLALLEAMALNSKRLKFRTFWRAVYFAPIVVSTVAVSLVFRLLYNNEYGFINTALLAFGGAPINWLGDTNTLKIAVMGIVVWRWTGLLSVYFLAGLQSIPEELYEAAAIDGATSWQRFRSITLPTLRPVILFVSIIVLIGSMQIFDDPQVLFGNATPGGPGNSALTMVQYLYRRGIGDLLFGYASAVGLFLFIVIFILSLIQFRVLRGFDNE